MTVCVSVCECVYTSVRVLITHNFLVKQPLRIVIVIVIIIVHFYVRLHVDCQPQLAKGVG